MSFIFIYKDRYKIIISYLCGFLISCPNNAFGRRTFPVSWNSMFVFCSLKKKNKMLSWALSHLFLFSPSWLAFSLLFDFQLWECPRIQVCNHSINLFYLFIYFSSCWRIAFKRIESFQLFKAIKIFQSFPEFASTE